MAENAMSTFLSNVGTIVTQIVTWIPTVVGVITDSPFLLFTVGFLAVGGCIGLVGRLLSRG